MSGQQPAAGGQLERDLRMLPGLLARTASDSEEEARTSAVQACRIIREHGLVVALPRSVPKKDRVAEWASKRSTRDRKIVIDPELVGEGLETASRVVEFWRKVRKVTGVAG